MTIASEITRLQGAKSCIKTAIENKGISVSSSLKLDSYYSCINAIPTAVYLTQQEYDALPSSKLTDGIPYGIMASGKVSKFIRNGTEYSPSSFVDYIVVGGGGAGGGFPSGTTGTCGGGGGGGGAVCVGSLKVEISQAIPVSIGAGGVGVSGGNGGGGGCSSLGGIIAYGGCGGGGGNGAHNGGNSGSGYIGGAYTNLKFAGGGAGASGDGCQGNDSQLRPGNGGPGLCGFGGGGGGGHGNIPYCGGGTACDGGGAGACCIRNGNNATNYGGGGGGTSNGISRYNSYKGGDGCQGVVIICYKTDGSCGISCATGGTVTTSGDYTVHTFTSDGTFTIVS